MLKAVFPPALRNDPRPLVIGGILGAFCIALFGTLRLNLPIWSLLLVPLVIGYVFLTVHKPIVGLIAVTCVFFVPFRFAIGISLLQLVGAASAGLILLYFLFNQHSLKFDRVQIPLLLLGVLILASIWFSLDTGRTLLYLRRWVFNMIFVALMLNLVTRFRELKTIVWAVILMAAVNAAYGIFDYSRSSETTFRSIGLMENANGFGHLAALAFPLAFYQYLYRRGTMRWVGLALSAVLVGGVVVSVSRGALVSVIVICAVTLFRERQRALPLLLVIAMVIPLIPVMPEYFNKRVGNLTEDIKNSLSIGRDRGLTSRGYLNNAGLKIWAAHPILGVGIGNFGHYYIQRDYMQRLDGTDEMVAHNIYVQALSETGLVGFGVLVSVLGISAYSIWRARRKSDRTGERWIYLGAIEMMALAIVVSTATYGSVMNNDFWMFIALTAISRRVVENDPEHVEQPAEQAVAA